MKLRIILDEKVITFDRKAFPKSGHFIMFVGGPGAGKGLIQRQVIAIQGKVFNPDDISKLVAKKEKLNLKDPEIARQLHTIAKKHHYQKIEYFLKSVQGKKGKELPNIIIDSTGASINELSGIIEIVKALGYETTLVLITVDKEVAWKRNTERSRVVPRDAFEKTYETAYANAAEYTRMVDNVWVVNGNLTGRFWETEPGSIAKIK